MGGKILDYRGKDLLKKGDRNRLIRQVRAKLESGETVEKIADDLVEEVGVIEEIVDELRKE